MQIAHLGQVSESASQAGALTARRVGWGAGAGRAAEARPGPLGS